MARANKVKDVATNYLDLKPEERKLIEEFDTQRGAGDSVKRIATLDRATEKWQGLTEEINDGYGLTIYDYTNDLSDRSIIENYLTELPEALRDKIYSIIAPIDERFRSLTSETDLTLMGQNPASYRELPWWYHRIPKKLVGELKEDIDQLEAGDF